MPTLHDGIGAMSLGVPTSTSASALEPSGHCSRFGPRALALSCLCSNRTWLAPGQFWEEGG